MAYSMNSKHFENVVKLNPEQRYEYAIKIVADWAELWVSENSATTGQSDIPLRIWPHPHFAEMYISDLTKPVRVEVHDWLNDWIPQLQRIQRSISVFPTELSERIVSAEHLQKDLQEELSEIED